MAYNHTLFLITISMMEDYILDMLKEQFIADKRLTAEVDKKIQNPDTGQIISSCSYILLVDIGIVYYNPLSKECYYHGSFPGTYFFGTTHFRLKRNFKPLLPFMIERLLIDAFDQKSPKTLVFTELLAKQMFKV